MVLTLIQSLGEAFVDLLLSPGPRRTDQQEMECIVVSYSDAIERVLGAEAGSLRLVDAATVKEWVDVIGEIAPVLE